jgi:hypothetical protein
MPRAAQTRTRAPRTRATLRLPSIITALDDPALFAPFFRGDSRATVQALTVTNGPL